MLTRLTISLNTDEIDFYKASALQGVLFEHVDSEYGEYLHQQSIHPYSEYLLKENDETKWIINTFNDEAYSHIIEPLLKPDFSGFKINKGNIDVSIKDKSLKSVDMKTLMDEFYSGDTERYFDIEILTPAAFKQNGSYNVLPEPRLIFQSLMNKYAAVSDNLSMADQDTLDEISLSSSIIQYRLRTVKFPLEGISIPGFLGKLTIKVKGSDTLARYARMLLKFGEFSGIGVKSSMGMGAMRIEKKEHH